MSTSTIPRPMPNRTTTPAARSDRLQPVAAGQTARSTRPAEAGHYEPLAEGPNLWQRTLMLFGTSFGVSLLLHLCVFSMLAFWIFRTPMPEILVIDSGVYDAKKIAEIETQEVKIAPASVPKDDVSPLKSNAAVHAVAAGSARVNFDIKFPDVPGMGTAKGGGDGKGIFGSGTSARSYVFVVDCSASMNGPRFTLAISELIQTIGRLRPSQRFFVVFYSDVTTPMFSEPSPFNAKDGGFAPGRFAMRRFNARRNRFGKRMGGRAPQIRRKRPATGKPRLLAASVSNRERAKRWIFKIQPGGGTLPGDALELALAMKPQVVYFLTDGEIPVSTPAIVRRANKSQIVVHTVALGYEGSADLLKVIARQNNGHYKFVK